MIEHYMNTHLPFLALECGSSLSVNWRKCFSFDLISLTLILQCPISRLGSIAQSDLMVFSVSGWHRGYRLQARIQRESLVYRHIPV